MNKFNIKIIYFILALFSIFILSGCAGGVLNELVEPASFQNGNKIDLKVVLYLDDEFRKTKWEDEPRGWEPNVIHLGENFVINSEAMVKAAFETVIVAGTSDKISKDKGDVLLIPRVISIEQNRPLWKWENCTMTVIVEWTLKDFQDNILWISTIKSEGVAKMMEDEARVKSLIDDLFGKSFQAIYSSPDIREYKKG